MTCFFGLSEHIEQKRRIALRVKATGLGFVEKLPGEIVDEAKALVAFAFAAGRDLRLVAFGRPGCVGGQPYNLTSPTGQNWLHRQRAAGPVCAALAAASWATEFYNVPRNLDSELG